MDCKDEMARFYYSQWDATFLLQSKKKNVLLAIDLLRKKKTAVSKDTVKKFCVPYLDAHQTVFSLVYFAEAFVPPPTPPPLIDAGFKFNWKWKEGKKGSSNDKSSNYSRIDNKKSCKKGKESGEQSATAPPTQNTKWLHLQDTAKQQQHTKGKSAANECSLD